MIYFIACPDAHAIKIGITGNSAYYKRLSMLQGACPLRLELLGVQDGYIPEERDLHRRFQGGHIHGEWFRPIPELRAHIETLQQIDPPTRPARSEKLTRVWTEAA